METEKEDSVLPSETSDTITISSNNLPDLNLSDLDIGLSSMSSTYGAVGSSPYTFSTGASNYNYGNVTISTTGGMNGTSGSFLYSNGTSQQWTNNTGAGLHVSSDAEFQGDIKWKGRSLGKLLEKIEDRLAILTPDPAKLEKYEALKKAYDHYKLMEKLIGED
jgi:hypothetical protein